MPDPLSSSPPRKPAPAGAPAAAPGISLTRDDILFILFRHKWLIAIFAVLGLVGAALFYFLQPTVYRSEAKLLVRYVFDAKGTEGVGTESQIKSAGSTAENIINSELEILTSLDLCEQVATAIGPDKILRRPASTNESLGAGAVLRRGLTVEVPRRSSVIQINLSHRDPEVAARALGQLVAAYLRRHVEVHRAIGAFDTVLSQQSDQFRARLAATEAKLREYKTNFVGVSIEDSRKALTDQLSRIRQDIFAAEADLAGSFAVASRNPSAAPITNNTATLTNTALVTNTASVTDIASATNTAIATNIAADHASPPPATVNEYRSLCSRLDSLRSQELDLIDFYTDENSRVKKVRQQIRDAEVRKKLLEEECPDLLRIEPAVRAPGAAPLPTFDGERLRIAGLQARYVVLTNQLAQVKAEIAVLDNIEGEVQRLVRAKELEEKNYRYYAAGIEQARFDEALAGGKLANISIIQAPTPSFRENTKRSKIALGLLAGGILGGLAIAFLFELFLDHSLKRPADVEDRLHLPLFVSIPRLSDKAESRKQKAEIDQHLLPEPRSSRREEAQTPVEPRSAEPLLGTHTPGEIRSAEPPLGTHAPGELRSAEPLLGTHTNAKTDVAEKGASVPTEPVIDQTLADSPAVFGTAARAFQSFFQTLRDRVLFHFEGLTHKPKLLGVTGCSHGSGVTTIAVGLASALSETGGGNVLLVDLNLERNAIHPFFNGRPGCGLADAIETDRREGGLVSENLYLATARNSGENGAESLPQRLSRLVPRLRVSDYDYIVFDLPRVTQTGITARLGGMMDLVLMVAESGKDQRDVLERALALLTASGAKVGGVLNKVQSYVPRRLRSHFYEPGNAS